MSIHMRSVAMNDQISRSSLGTPAARELRARTPASVTKAIVTRSSERATTIAPKKSK